MTTQEILLPKSEKNKNKITKHDIIAFEATDESEPKTEGAKAHYRPYPNMKQQLETLSSKTIEFYKQKQETE